VPGDGPPAQRRDRGQRQRDAQRGQPDAPAGNRDGLVLTTALNETLRRLHAALGDAFHTERAHAIEIARLKREWKVRALPGLAHLDTTLLTPDQVAAEAIAFWQSTPEV
jgi:hypothetical protein